MEIKQLNLWDQPATECIFKNIKIELYPPPGPTLEYTANFPGGFHTWDGEAWLNELEERGKIQERRRTSR